MTPDEEKKVILENMELADALDFKAIRDVLWRIIEKGGIYSTSGPLPVEDANYRNGKREIIIDLIAEIEEANSGAWVAMQNDNKEGDTDGR